MTRQEAEEKVSERWINLGLDRKTAPIMFGMDVENLLEEVGEDEPEESLGAYRDPTEDIRFA
jgi:hypothetical protein